MASLINSINKLIKLYLIKEYNFREDDSYRYN